MLKFIFSYTENNNSLPLAGILSRGFAEVIPSLSKKTSLGLT